MTLGMKVFATGAILFCCGIGLANVVEQKDAGAIVGLLVIFGFAGMVAGALMLVWL